MRLFVAITTWQPISASSWIFFSLIFRFYWITGNSTRKCTTRDLSNIDFNWKVSIVHFKTEPFTSLSQTFHFYSVISFIEWDFINHNKWKYLPTNSIERQNSRLFLWKELSTNHVLAYQRIYRNHNCLALNTFLKVTGEKESDKKWYRKTTILSRSSYDSLACQWTLKSIQKNTIPPPLPLYCAPFMMSETSTKIVTLKPECGSHLIWVVIIN